MTQLSVNLNKIALLRNSREGDYPSVLAFAKLAIEAGADGITVHPRPDQRHIRVDDVYTLSDYIRTIDHVEFNIEGNPFAETRHKNNTSTYPGLMKLIEDTRPDQATLVPDSNEQLTSDHGFNLHRDGERLRPILEKLRQLQVRSSLFMDPDLEQIALANTLNVDRIELYTGPYAHAYRHAPDDISDNLNRYHTACTYANSIGIQVNAGHDLNLHNLKAFLEIGDIAEVSIGHALTVDALLMGYKQAIVNYSSLCHHL
jgi:pyridoxine 5-phosphate synthase